MEVRKAIEIIERDKKDMGRGIICENDFLAINALIDYYKKIEEVNNNKIITILSNIKNNLACHISPSKRTDSYEDGWNEGAAWAIDGIQEEIDAFINGDQKEIELLLEENNED